MWSGSPTAPCSTAFGMTGTRRATKSYLEDVDTAKLAHRPAAPLYRDLRAGAESGWDYSSRWLTDGKTLTTIDTTALLPVDLNSEMFHLESDLAYAYRLSGDTAEAKLFAGRAAMRAAAIRRLMWDAKDGDFTDYDWQTGRQTHVVSAAMVVPLFFHVATKAEADAVAAAMQANLLEPGGIRTTHEPYRPAMGCAERLGAAAVDGGSRLRPLRRRCAGPDDR